MISINNVTKIIDNKVLFENINIEFKKGKFYILTGASGSGKSSLLNVIGGLDSHYSGKIYLNGKDVNARERIKQFDYLFQNFALLESKTIKYNLRIAKKATDEKYLELLEVVNLNVSLDQYVHTLSGGEQQRLALARLLLSNRDYILADEPTASLDIENRNYIIEMLMSLNRQGKTIIMVTHDEAVIKYLGQYYPVYLIKDQKLVLKN